MYSESMNVMNQEVRCPKTKDAPHEMIGVHTRGGLHYGRLDKPSEYRDELYTVVRELIIPATKSCYTIVMHVQPEAVETEKYANPVQVKYNGVLRSHKVANCGKVRNAVVIEKGHGTMSCSAYDENTPNPLVMSKQT